MIISKSVTLRTLFNFFLNLHPRPLVLVYSGFMQQTNIIFNKTALKTSQGAQEKQKSD